MTESTGFPAGTRSIIFLGTVRLSIKTLVSLVPFTTKSFPSLSNFSMDSFLDDNPMAEKPFSATFKIKFLPITPNPTNPKSYFIANF